MSPDNRHEPAAEQRSAGGAGARPGSRREIASSELLGDAREIHIRHAGEIYTLRQTNKGKLILTK